MRQIITINLETENSEKDTERKLFDFIELFEEARYCITGKNRTIYGNQNGTIPEIQEKFCESNNCGDPAVDTDEAGRLVCQECK